MFVACVVTANIAIGTVFVEHSLVLVELDKFSGRSIADKSLFRLEIPESSCNLNWHVLSDGI